MNNNEFERINLDLEYLQSSMELKLHQAKESNQERDCSDATNKILMIQNIKAEFYNLFYEKESLVKSHIKITLQNEILTLKTLEQKK